MWDASLGSTMLAVVRPRYLCRDPGMAARFPIAIASSLILKACVHILFNAFTAP
jgi:hypothetical protein